MINFLSITYIIFILLIIMNVKHYVNDNYGKIFNEKETKNIRHYFLNIMLKTIDPLLNELYKRNNITNILKKTNNCYFSDLINIYEGFIRCFDGISFWIRNNTLSENENILKEKYRKNIVIILEKLIYKIYKNKKELKKSQFLVLQSALFQSLIRSNIFNRLSNDLKNRIYKMSMIIRKIKPPENNWLLFQAYLEYGLYKYYNNGNLNIIEKNVIKVFKWYYKDGIYYDGNNHKFNYYSSYVFHPMLYELLLFLKDDILSFKLMFIEEEKRMILFSEYLLGIIKKDGSYPLIGRSLGFRYAILYSLSLSNYYHLHNQSFQVKSRDKMMLVINKYLKSGIFDDNGFLYVGLYGHNEKQERYMCSGSVYFTISSFCILGLDENDIFWK